MPYATRATRRRGGGACAVWPYWRARCVRFGVTNWNYVSANADNGILWWLYNISGLGAARVLYRPSTPRGEPEPTASGAWWAHAQSMCKPWLATPKILAGSERCSGINDYFFCTLWPEMAEALQDDCPAFEAARRGVASQLSCPAGHRRGAVHTTNTRPVKE